MSRPTGSSNRRGVRSSTISHHPNARRRAEQARSQRDDYSPKTFEVDRNGQLQLRLTLPLEVTREGLRVKTGGGITLAADGSLQLKVRQPLFLNSDGEIEAPPQAVSEFVPDATVVANSVGGGFPAINAEIDALRDATVADLDEIRDALVAAGLMEEDQ